jgi:hypothetical protein
LLAAAIERFESHGLLVCFHCHDEVTVETPIDSLSDAEFLDILLKLPSWATGLPLGGKVHSGPHYLEPPEHPAEPLTTPDTEQAMLEQAINTYIDDVRTDGVDPIGAEPEDDGDLLAEDAAPLTALVSLPLAPGNKVQCPFHDDGQPSCVIYPDHYHCFGCGEHGSRLNWLVRVEGMTAAEAATCIQDWPIERAPRDTDDEAEKLAYIKSIWASAQGLTGSVAERYLDETRDIDLTRLGDIHGSLRFHPNCVFGPGTHLPCLIALMRDPLTDELVGIQRIALEERDGRIEKIERRMVGHAGVVKLWPPGAHLVVGEGLETVLAAATRVTYRDNLLSPAWAVMSAGSLASFPVIPGVERLIILVDHDDAGIAAACQCTERWTRAERTVIRLTPKRAGSDFNDLVIESELAA